MHEKEVGYGPRGSGLSGSGRPFVSLLSRPAAGLVFCCLVSTCIFLPWLLCSCVLLCRMLGLPWAFLGPLLGFSWLRRAILRLLAAPGARRPSWASAGLLLGSPLAGPGGPWAPLGVTLGGSWVSLGPPLGRSRPIWGHPGGFLGLLWDVLGGSCLLYTSPSPRDTSSSRMPSSA